MKKLILTMAVVFATGTMMNATSSDEEITTPIKENIEIVEDFGCARNCVDLGITVAYHLNLTVKEYLVVYESCYIQNCAQQ
ncbi:MAG: hypothetical protein ABJH82_10480 [Polaribacter sp.]|uniref:hypothetical protein n=1 Tax=Flavobacteriaceae TaxID=49546 RepID=UPI003264ABBD